MSLAATAATACTRLQVTPPLLPPAALYRSSRVRQAVPSSRSPQGSPVERVASSPVQRPGSEKKQSLLLPRAALYRAKQSLAVPCQGDPTPRHPSSRSQCHTVAASPNGGAAGSAVPQASPGSLHSSRGSTPSLSPAGLGQLRLCLASPSPLGAVCSSVASLASRRRAVRFSSPLNTEHEITPYQDFYGTHPSSFDFDAEGNMMLYSPAADWSSPFAAEQGAACCR
eukprot:TRINITY_DN26303_c0_g2_i1.p2 TRINITY_DN26303_c0_g2~~TRINITY_DN26303_c0_g2_i1.p2  ORF type:complete len:226 (+),score=33.38 TRINITY_DN26303_c0_g2_i1:60-737(+)